VLNWKWTILFCHILSANKMNISTTLTRAGCGWLSLQQLD